MAESRFVYVTYIDSTPEKVWDALLDPEMTRRYWGRHRNASDWQAGSSWEHQDYDDAAVVDSSAKSSRASRRDGWCSRGPPPPRPAIHRSTRGLRSRSNPPTDRYG